MVRKRSGHVFEIMEADVKEISLVDKGANRRSFYIIKSFKGGMSMKEFKKAFKSLFGERPEKDLVKAVSALDEDEIQKRTEALETLAEVKDDFDADVQKALETLIGDVLIIKEIKEVEKKVAPEMPEEVKKAIEVLESYTGKKIEPAEKVVKEDRTDSDLVEVDLEKLQEDADEKADGMIESIAKKQGIKLEKSA